MNNYKAVPDGVEWGREHRIIGVEFALDNGHVREELMMLVPPNGKYDLPARDMGTLRRLRITLHTSDGDYTGQLDLDSRQWFNG